MEPAPFAATVTDATAADVLRSWRSGCPIGGCSHPGGSAYLDRANRRPGMAVPDGILVSAFADAGWSWGGAGRSNPDYQHFSTNGK